MWLTTGGQSTSVGEPTPCSPNRGRSTRRVSTIWAAVNRRLTCLPPSRWALHEHPRTSLVRCPVRGGLSLRQLPWCAALQLERVDAAPASSTLVGGCCRSSGGKLLGGPIAAAPSRREFSPRLSPNLDLS